MEIKIEHDIPIPERPRSRPRYPWHEMSIGDSFLFPDSMRRSGYTAVRQASERYGKTFVARATAQGLRCWRLA